MTERRPGGHKYPVSYEPNETDKYLPSLFFDVEIDKQIIKAEARPLRKDKGYYTVNLNKVFLAHIHLMGNQWKDFLGNTNEIYQAVGNQIKALITV